MGLVGLRLDLITDHPPSVLWHCWLGHVTCKNIVPEWPILCPNDLYCVEWDVKPYSTQLSSPLASPFSLLSSPPVDNVRIMVIVWRLRGKYYQNCSVLDCVIQIGFVTLGPYAVHRGSCLELYYCNMVEWFWWDSSLIYDDQLVSFSALTLLVWSSGL